MLVRDFGAVVAFVAGGALAASVRPPGAALPFVGLHTSLLSVSRCL